MPLIDGKFTGYCKDEELPFKKGDRVRIKKGTVLRSTHPDPAKKRFAAKRTYVVTAFDVHNGATKTAWAHGLDADEHLSNPDIVWPGTGGYWFYADVNDVEKVEG